MAQAMTATEVRKMFNDMIAIADADGNADMVAKLELSREYFTNPEFKAWLEEYTFQQAMKAA